MQSLVPPHLRATSSATQLAITNVFGYCVSSFAVGALSDALQPAYGAAAMRFMLLLPAAAGALAAPLFWRFAASVRADLAAFAHDAARAALSGRSSSSPSRAAP